MSSPRRWFTTATNIPYGIASVLPFMDGTIEGAFSGVALLSLMIGSGLFHAFEKLHNWAHRYDELSMYVVMATACVFGLSKIGGPVLEVALVYSFLIVWMASVLDWLNTRIVIPIMALGVLIPLWIAVGIESLVAALLIIVAIVIRQSGHTKFHRDFGWTHGVWHIVAAISIALTYWLFMNP